MGGAPRRILVMSLGGGARYMPGLVAKWTHDRLAFGQIPFADLQIFSGNVCVSLSLMLA